MATWHDQLADEWRQRARELAQWTMQRLVNRTDVWGRYLAPSHRRNADGKQNNAITAPFRDERGKVFLAASSLEKHFKRATPGNQLGLHSTSSDQTSRWFALDLDLHDEDDPSLSPEGNFAAAHGWYTRLQEMGFDPLLMDSNGAGSFHLLVLCAEPVCTQSLHAFLLRFISDYVQRGLDQPPEIFPGKGRTRHYGNWLRLPGHHHTREHFTRVWNDEPWADEKWLEGDAAIERMLRTIPASMDVLEQHGVQRKRRTVCLDFDGVIHSYRSGWCGEAVIPDPPIHRAAEAIARLRRSFRVVIHSPRCRTKAGRQAIQRWLTQHGIEVDDICEHKPPATVYLDDRALPFTGDWDEAIAAIFAWRK
jgi:hypothetical protein